MSATALIVFREVLEAALIVGIVLAATRGLAGRMRWILAGVGGGVAGAILVAAGAEAIANAAEGMGQELFNAAVLLIAVAMLSWHTVWMSRAGSLMAREARELGSAVRAADRPLSALAIVVGAAVLREGAEVVLLLYGIAASGGTDMAGLLVDGVIGLALGGLAGAALYLGLVRLTGRFLFSVTGGLILLLAAGMAAQAARLLVQAGYLPSLGTALWDSSAVLSEGSTLGAALHALIGYTARPDGIQLLFYVATLAIVSGLKLWLEPGRPRHPAVAPAIGAGLLLLAAGTPVPARADELKVYAPTVEEGELAVEVNGFVTNDKDAEKSGAQNHRFELEYGATSFWQVGLVGQFSREAEGGGLHHTATAIENVFQLLPQGEYWLDLGAYAEYSFGHHGEPDEIEGKILAAKDFGPVTVTLNPIFEKEVGHRAVNSTEFKYAAQVRWRLMPELEPAIEAYGDIGQLRALDPPGEQRHQIGPVLLGRFRLGNSGAAIRYEAGYLFGLTRVGSPRGTFKWLTELEFRF